MNTPPLSPPPSPDSASPAPLLADDPRQVGPYRLVGRLGTGGMGTVYAALDTQGTCIALKMVRPELADRPDYRRAFARETALLAGLDALCAPRLLQADADAPRPWAATEYVPGHTLSAHLRDRGPVQGPALAALAAGTAEALAALHARGVLHRDIKPANVVLSPRGPRVLDFGIARRTRDRPDQQEGVYGTPGYTAPERLAGRQETSAADIFAWGALVAFAATGRSPFTGATDAGTGNDTAGTDATAGGGVAGVLRRTREGTYDLEGVPEELVPLVERALSPAPERRPSADECVRRCLALATGGGPLGAPGPVGGEPETAEPGHETSGAQGSGQQVSERGRLAGLLGAVWHGFDGAGHDPGVWGAMLAGTGAAGAGAGAVLATAGSTTSTAASATGASASAGGAALGGSAASAGAGASAAGVGSSVAGVVGTKALALTAGGALLAAAVGTGSYFAGQAAAENERRATIEQAGQVLAEGEGFTARFTRRLTGEREQDYSGAGQGPVAEVVQAGESVFQVRYAGGQRPTFMTEILALEGQELQEEDDRDEIVANVDGEVHAYSPEQVGQLSVQELGGEEPWYEFTDRFTPEAYSVDTVVEPLHRLAEAEDLVEEGTETVAGVEATRYSGGFSVPALLGEVERDLEATGRAWLDADGAPVQLEYSTSDWEVEIEFTETDTPVEIEEPDMSHNASWSSERSMLIHTPVCGQVTNADGDDFVVYADTWDVGCERAMTVATEFAHEEGGELVEELSDSHSQRYLLDDLVCEQLTYTDGNGRQEAPEPLGCSPVTVVEDATDPEERYDIDHYAMSVWFLGTEPPVEGQAPHSRVPDETD